MRAAEAVGATVRWIAFDPATGELTADDVAAVLTERTRLVAVTGASNLIGTRPPIAEIAAPRARGRRAAGRGRRAPDRARADRRGRTGRGLLHLLALQVPRAALRRAGGRAGPAGDPLPRQAAAVVRRGAGALRARHAALRAARRHDGGRRLPGRALPRRRQPAGAAGRRDDHPRGVRGRAARAPRGGAHRAARRPRVVPGRAPDADRAASPSTAGTPPTPTGSSPSAASTPRPARSTRSRPAAGSVSATPAACASAWRPTATRTTSTACWPACGSSSQRSAHVVAGHRARPAAADGGPPAAPCGPRRAARCSWPRCRGCAPGRRRSPGRSTLAGMPPTTEPGGTSVPWVTTAPAATIEPEPMCAPFITMLPMPTRTSSSTRAPCRTTRWPTVTPLPISSGKPGSECSVQPSWTLEPSPISIVVGVGAGDGAVPDARLRAHRHRAHHDRRRRHEGLVVDLGASRSPVQRCSCRVARRPPRSRRSAQSGSQPVISASARGISGGSSRARKPSRPDRRGQPLPAAAVQEGRPDRGLRRIRAAGEQPAGDPGADVAGPGDAQARRRRCRPARARRPGAAIHDVTPPSPTTARARPRELQRGAGRVVLDVVLLDVQRVGELQSGSG